ncbi:MAG: hypothetical protein KBG15_07480 [Kofleriaceae bacterium]|nr:hypothetical protein [Kofleriaceae bacterium]
MRILTSIRSFLLIVIVAAAGCTVDSGDAPPEDLGSVGTKGGKSDQYGIETWKLAYDHSSNEVVVYGHDVGGKRVAEARVRSTMVETDNGRQQGSELSLEYPDSGRVLLAKDGTVVEDSLSSSATGRSLVEALRRDFADEGGGKSDAGGDCYVTAGLAVTLCAAAVALCVFPGSNVLFCVGGAGTCAEFAYASYGVCTTP